MKKNKLIVTAAAALAGFFLISTNPVAAQEDDWEFTANPYMWYASVGGKSATGGDIDVDASDLIDTLDLAFSGNVQAHKGKWSFLTEVLFLDIDERTSGIDVGLRNWIVTPAVGYNLIKDENLTLDILGGARCFWLKAKLDLSDLGGPRLSDSGDVWDGIVGLKGELNLTEKWSMPFYMDIGAGGTDMSWQASGGLAYKLEKCDLFMGYRYLEFDFDKNDAIDDLDISGPYVGIKIPF